MPEYTSLKVFGCACYPNLRPYNTHKFDFHTTKCVYLCTSGQHKGFKCLSPTGRVYVSRHVVFNEKEFPFKHGFLNTRKTDCNTKSLLLLSSFPIANTITECQQDFGSKSSSKDSQNASSDNDKNSEVRFETDDMQGDSRDTSIEYTSHVPSVSTSAVPSKAPQYLPITDERKLVLNLNLPNENSTSAANDRIITRSMRGISKPKVPYVGVATTNKTSQLTEPQSVFEALAAPQWKKVM